MVIKTLHHRLVYSQRELEEELKLPGKIETVEVEFDSKEGLTFVTFNTGEVEEDGKNKGSQA